MSRHWFLPIMALVIAGALGAWFFLAEPEHFSERLRASVCSGRTAVALSDATDFDWDEVVILEPYDTQATAEKALGFPWAGYLFHDDELQSEVKDVLIFLKGGHIVRTVDHPRIDGDFAETAGGRRLARNRAVFAVHRVQGSCDFARLELTAPN